MKTYASRLPLPASRFLMLALLACVLASCERQGDRPMPPPGKPPRPQAVLELPPEPIQKALFPVPSSSVRFGNGQILITAHHVIHT